MGATNDHPHPLDFMYRLRWYILGRNSAAVFTESRNTEESEEKCLVQPLQYIDLESNNADEFCLTQQISVRLWNRYPMSKYAKKRKF